MLAEPAVARSGGATRPRDLAAALLLFAVVVAAHAASTEVIQHLGRVTSPGEIFFPAAGLTVVALLLLPRRLWPLVLVGVFGSELLGGTLSRGGAMAAVGPALAHTLEPAVGTMVLVALAGGWPVLSRRRQLAAFIAGPAVAGPAVGALVAALTYAVTISHLPFVTVLARRWTSDALGVLIVGGLLMTWLSETTWPIRPRYRALEACALAGSAGLLTWLAFWKWQPGLVYLCLLPLGWAAIRFGPRGVTSAAALIAAVAEWATITDHGLFAAIASHEDSAQAVWLLQLFLAIAILGGLVAANQVADLSRAEAALRDSERAEREARHAAQEALAAERSRLARELHDSVSQALFSMTMHAGTAQIALERGAQPASRPLARAIDQLAELTVGALAEMRALIFELRPGALAEEGLVAALVRQAAALSAREQVPITVDGPGERLPLSPQAEEHSYRIVLEALHNAVRHAAPAHAAVTVVPDGPVVRIVVTDDGSGFDSNAQRPGTMGLRTMAERADKIGGDLQVTTMPGAGTRLQLTVPAEPGPPGKGEGE